MEKAKFTVYGEPKGKGRPRFNTKTGHAMTPKDTVSYENLVKLEWQTAYGTESFPKEAMLDMRIKAYYRIPKSASKKKRAAMLAGEIRPTKKPDMDNVVKIIPGCRLDRDVAGCKAAIAGRKAENLGYCSFWSDAEDHGGSRREVQGRDWKPYADNGDSHTAGVYAGTEHSLYEGYVWCFFIPGGNQTGYPGCGSQRNIGHV